MFPKYEYRDCPINVTRRKNQGSYPARFHKHLEVMAVYSSQVRVTIDGQNYLLHPGDLYVVFPNVLHAIEATDAEAVVMIVDFEKYPAFQDVLLHNRPEVPVLQKGTFAPVVHELLNRMVSLMPQEASRTQDILSGYANALLGELLMCLKLVKRSTDSNLMQRLIFYILENYTSPISLEGIAQSLGYSKFYISREIRTLFGCNLPTLINSYRLSMAQNLLLTTDLSVGRIAADCGFQNQSAFNRLFLKQVSMTPGQYRLMCTHPPEMPAIYMKD